MQPCSLRWSPETYLTLTRGEHWEKPYIWLLPWPSLLLPCCLFTLLNTWQKKDLKKQEPARPSWESEGIRTKCLECPSKVKIKQGLLATAVRVATLLVQTKVWVKPSPRLKPDTIGGSAESQKAKGISCNHLLSCFLFHKLQRDQVLRSLCHFPLPLPRRGYQQSSRLRRGAAGVFHGGTATEAGWSSS